MSAESLIKEGAIIKDRWEIIHKLGSGGFGQVFRAKDLIKKSEVALKLESAHNSKQFLKMEVAVLKKLAGLKHFCNFIACGRNVHINYIVMNVQGENLAVLRSQQPFFKFTLSTTLRSAIQMLKAIEKLHSIGFLHRDVKPSNYAIGAHPNNRHVIHLIDFGLSRQYVLPSGEVRPARKAAGFRGTIRYASVNTHQNNEMGRHDDIWSLYYMLVEFLTGNLPWRKLKDKNEVTKMKEKHQENPNVMLEKFPIEMKEFVNHIKQLDYADKPDYKLLYDLLEKALKKRRIKYSDRYDWEDESYAITSSLNPNNADPTQITSVIVSNTSLGIGDNKRLSIIRSEYGENVR